MRLKDSDGRQALGYAFWVSVALASALFWGLRIYYWSSIDEPPFSDMAGFDSVGRGIASRWDFSWGPNWHAYVTPTLPFLRAVQIWMLGEGMDGWRWFQAVLTFGGLIWLAFELVASSRRSWIALLTLFFVALSVPSIFWSYKLSHEGVQEAFGYLLTAALLRLVRRPSLSQGVLTGALLGGMILNRASAAVLLGFVPLALWYLRNRSQEFQVYRGNRLLGLRDIAALLVGLVLIWGPWIVRNYQVYGEFVPLSTQGPFTFLWELGRVDVVLPDGEHVQADVTELQAAINESGDLVASRRAAAIGAAWLRTHRWEYLGMVIERLDRMIKGRVIYLTKVPRKRIFAGPLDWLSIDKNEVTAYLALVGLIPLVIEVGAPFCLLVIVASVPGAASALLIGYARMFESAVPVLMIGLVGWGVLLINWLRSRPLKFS